MYTKAKLRDLTVTELKQLARDKCVQGFSKLRKAQLVTLLSKKAPKSRCPKTKGCATLIQVTGVETASPDIKLFEVPKPSPQVPQESQMPKLEQAPPITIKLEPIP